MTTPTHAPVIPGYKISSQLYVGSRTRVYRAIREQEAVPVVIKVLASEYPSLNELLQFRNQYTISKNLNIPGIIHPLSLEAYRNGYILVMEDRGEISLREYIEPSTISLVEFLAIAIQLTDILHDLHQNCVIHKDIKPANILIHPQTKEVKLIDFSIASLLPKETQEIKNPNILQGTLAYISPEQTGRMNRGIDYRSDFYSLGVTFYELLTGELPFTSDEPMELVYCHIAKMPRELGNREEIPQVLSDIVMKLMAKNAEDRYQSALGLKYDLEKCLYQLKETGKVRDFEIGKRDVCDRFLIPEKLYGRETEVTTLLAAFERVANGNSEMMLVAGFSGIGKTAIVNEVHKPITRQQGYFIKGKFDQLNRNIPLSAFVQALRDLIRQFLSEFDTQLAQWKTKILEVLGGNGQVLIEMIPELEQIIGKQPPVPELLGTAAQNRFNLLFQKFIAVLTTKEHPLVMFIDDLQWADLASLQLIKLLIQDSNYLLLLGAYRDNEVQAAHPFILMVEEVKKAGKTVNTITLSPLALSDTNQLVADTLHCPIELSLPLTELINRKTQGNPFFITQFLKVLHENGKIKFNCDQGYWECDIDQINALSLTDDVVEFMGQQLQKLPRETQEVLKLAACIGSQFDLATLAIVWEQSPADTAVVLWKALQEGLILPQSQMYKFYLNHDEADGNTGNRKNVAYRFLHDRVQQAAYSLIPENRKQATHLKIGQLLQNNLSEIEKEEKLFDIVGHLNLGQDLITQPREQEALAQLNLSAGRKARNATAYNTSKVYLQIGIDLLTSNCWQRQYELTLNLYVAATESAYLNGEFEEMEQKATQVLQSAQTILDKVKIYEIQISALTAQSRMLEAIAVGQNALVQLGIEFSLKPDEALTNKTLKTLAIQLQDKQIEELINLPVMSNQETMAAMQLLTMLFPAIFQGNPALMPLVCSIMVNLSLQFGNALTSTTGYVGYGMVLCAFLGEVEKGYGFGQLALSLLDQLNAREFKSLTLLWFIVFLQHRQEALRAAIPMTKEGYFAGMETGDFLSAGYNIVNYFGNNFFAGVTLDDWEPEIENYCAVLAQAKQDSPVVYLKMMQQVVHNLREIVSQPDLFSKTAYDEKLMLPKHHQDNDLTALADVYIYKLMLAYFFGNYNHALDYIAKVELYLMAVAGLTITQLFHFYAGLTYLAVYSTQSEIEQAKTLTLIETHQNTLEQWAYHAPMNYQHKVDLVESEKCRILGKNYQAGDWYDRAIGGAKANGYIQEEALANELAAKFYLAWGRDKVASSYMQQAYYCYAHWGAKAKVVHLEQQYPQLLAAILQPTNFAITSEATIASTSMRSVNSSNSSQNLWLDLPAVMKAAQAISQEIELEKLLTILMQIAIANAGAQTSNLIIRQDEQWLIVAQADQQKVKFLEIPLEKCQEIPQSLIYAITRTQETAVFENLSTVAQFASDRYIMTHQPKSVLCTPISHQGKLIGVLYLENNLTLGAFTSDRIEILQLLTTQAAISIENARLYQQTENYSHTLEAEVKRKTQALNQKAQDLESALQQLKQTQGQLIHSEKMSSLGQLVAGIAHEINNPVNFIKGNLTHTENYIADMMSLLTLYEQEYPQPSLAIQDKREKIDLDFLFEDANQILESMKVGSDRISQIVLSLRNFSRLDEAEIKAVDLHSGIESTLLILQHRLPASGNQPELHVIKEYGNLPLVTCYPSQLNQVFLNIINNAIDAIRDNPERSKNPEIRIRTEVIDTKRLRIAIANTDSTIPMSLQNRIFEPFFTTKPIGRGAGLGLFVSYSIIQQHRGTLTVRSKPTEGTEFEIVLPIY
ncbi:MAG: trifunctional serine/threonine-protein kinase/ATP-binding protein/sensor histidine kinase [Nostoc sp.]